MAQAGHNAHLTNVLQSAITDRVDRGDAESDDKRKQYKCEHCLRTFKHPGNFKQHLASHMRSATIAQDAVDLNSSAPPVLSTLSSAPSKKRSHSHGSSTPAGASAAKAVKLESEVQLPQSPVPPQQLQLLACPECHLEFPGVEALQGHIAVNHKHLDVEMPGDLQKTFTDRAKSVLQQQQSFICELCNQGFKTEGKDSRQVLHLCTMMLELDLGSWRLFKFGKAVQRMCVAWLELACNGLLSEQNFIHN